MLSRRFTAHEALIVAEKANKILDEIDAIITDAILSGHTEAHILLYDHNILPNGGQTEIGKIFNEADSFFISHYQSRRFIIEKDGSYLRISCPKK